MALKYDAFTSREASTEAQDGAAEFQHVFVCSWVFPVYGAFSSRVFCWSLYLSMVVQKGHCKDTARSRGAIWRSILIWAGVSLNKNMASFSLSNEK